MSTPCSSSRALTAASVEDSGEAATASTCRIFSLLLPIRYLHRALRLPAHDRFQVGQRVISVANGFPGLEGSLFKLMLLLAGGSASIALPTPATPLQRAEAGNRRPSLIAFLSILMPKT